MIAFTLEAWQVRFGAIDLNLRPCRPVRWQSYGGTCSRTVVASRAARCYRPRAPYRTLYTMMHLGVPPIPCGMLYCFTRLGTGTWFCFSRRSAIDGILTVVAARLEGRREGK